ncbi:hypothetical protein [Rhodococcus sp. IEGM1428]|uniref:hypothetical protein n=1 Tax=Rhodococcus sp. IEGM1428 TaxID=3392191 RepID=UPI003D0E4AFE
MSTFRARYGAGPLHLAVTACCLALGAVVVLTIGFPALWNTDVWWQSIGLWFVGAAVVHDAILFPLYALLDRTLVARLGRFVNAVRIPALGAGLSLLLFAPGIFSQGSETYEAATGLTQEPYAMRWLLLVAGMFVASAVLYGGREALRTLRSRPVGDNPKRQHVPN